MKPFCEELNKLMEESGVTGSTLARRFRVSAGKVSAWRSGDIVPLHSNQFPTQESIKAYLKRIKALKIANAKKRAKTREAVEHNREIRKKLRKHIKAITCKRTTKKQRLRAQEGLSSLRQQSKK